MDFSTILYYANQAAPVIWGVVTTGGYKAYQLVKNYLDEFQTQTDLIGKQNKLLETQNSLLTQLVTKKD